MLLGTLDNVVGYITMRDVLALAWERKEVLVADILRPAFFVPEAASAGRVLQEMQRRKVPLVVVVDEHGGVAGLITLEDLVEELVGDLASEDERADVPVRVQPDGSALVRGTTAIRDVNRELGIELAEGEGFTTIAGLCVSLAGGIPQPGTRLQAGDQVLEVVEASARAVGLVGVRAGHPPLDCCSFGQAGRRSSTDCASVFGRPHDGAGERDLGCSPHPQRACDGGHRGGHLQGGEVHAPAPRAAAPHRRG